MMHTAISFPDWLKQQRRSQDLTRKALAQRAHCSDSAVRRMEAGDLRPSKELARLLAVALKIPPAAQEEFVQFARGLAKTTPSLETEISLTATNIANLGNLPSPLTSLVGRKQEIAAVCGLLRKSGTRLLTISGPPGTGKTRLSLAAAAKLSGHAPFPHGAFFVSLALVSDGQLVATTIAQALGLSETPTGARPVLQIIQEHLRQKKLLLVLDNFEQITNAAHVVTDLLTAVPGLKILVTSREVLHIYGEHEFSLAPLLLPNLNHLPQEGVVAYLARYPAIRLFQERARAVRPDFQLTADNITDVARICAWLDGLPLAIEMAAAQMKWLPPGKVFSQLQHRLTALTGGPRDVTPRQQSLLGAISWSYNLLTSAQKFLFAVLGVFASGCDVSAVCAITKGLRSAEGEKVDPHNLTANLQLLIEKSLLTCQLTSGGDGRFVMLETLREFALMQLETQNLLAPVQQAHAYFYAQLAESAVNHIIDGCDQAGWLNCLEQEQHNIRAAFTWATETAKDVTLALTLAESMCHFWLMRGHLAEGCAWQEKALALKSELATLPFPI